MNNNVNPNIKNILKNTRIQKYTAQEFAEGIIKGDRNLLSKAISCLESRKIEDELLAEEIVKLCLPYSGKSKRIGITGVPGVGKSTFIDIFGIELIEKKSKIAILAIDPSSSISGGSILGDKTRMELLSSKFEAFIRPSPSVGVLGGVAAKTRESIIFCEAAGFDTIIIETVGVGQSEISVASMVDVFMMLLVAGTGDELQGIKRGIMEMTDILVFTKDDGDNVHRTYAAKKQFETALKMFPSKNSGWIPKVLSISAVESKGIKEVLDVINEYFYNINSNNFFETNRKNQSIQWLNDQIISNLKTWFFAKNNFSYELQLTENEVINTKISPIAAARKLVEKFVK
jgi:LAO/AO transport system kinase